MMPKAECVILIVAAVAFSSVAALERLPPSYDYFKTNAYNLVYECGSQFSIDKGTVQEAIDKDYVQNLNPCFLGCIFEKTGLINDKGYATPEVATARLEPYINEYETYKYISGVLNKCAERANAQNPKDTCESGSLLAPCLLEDYIAYTASH